ncbi:MerR family transcriptional regulator [Streptomyces nigrescens]|uniref:MerR family transcriptional regulator n=1 Tax=Streptomyces nigrescens TaxID=1920 RepID=A0ABY7J1N5_STRNI|nr:MerR family transcriptional regulator [Streptomyces nigrescens]WAU05018.1 MerR family transcriptional regulator [Streptomyces nigrescens]
MRGKQMRIGELAHRTGVSTRVLRYYEERGLLRAQRDANGYRRYDEEESVERVGRIRELLALGLNTDDIGAVLPCAQGGPGLMPCAFSSGIVERQMSQLEAEIAELSRRRAALEAYAQVMEERRAEDEALAARALRSA